MITNDIVGGSPDGRAPISRTLRLFAEGIPDTSELDEPTRQLIRAGGENDGPSRQLARFVQSTAHRHVPALPVQIIYRRDRYLRGGDHLPFLRAGYPALRFTEGVETFRHQHQNVRTEQGVRYGDLPEFVDLEYVADVARSETSGQPRSSPCGVWRHERGHRRLYRLCRGH
jgi:hypothetical protein